MNRSRKEMENVISRYDRNGRVPTPQNDWLPQQYDMVMPYQRSSAGHPPTSAPHRSNGAHGSDHRLQQNMAAVLYYNNLERGKVFEGRQASVAAQMHQNDLHDVSTNQELVHYNQNGFSNGLVDGKPDRSKNYIKRYLNIQTKFARAQDTHSPEKLPHSDLITSFDPMQDRHMWTMWRTAVNGRIVDEVRQLEQRKSELGGFPSSSIDASVPGVYGKALVVPPLKRFIKFGNEQSKAVAVKMSYGLGQGSLETSQFVYYGLPRVYVPQIRK